LIDKYEIKYFLPEQSEEDYIVLAENPVSRARLAFEMGVYLKYMTDGRIAHRWEQLLAQHQDLAHLPPIRELIRAAAGRNESLRGLAEGLAL